MIKIAFLQLLPSECVEENMEKGIHYCKEARKLGADIALFPEMWSCGYHIPHDLKKLNELAIPTDGEFVTCYAELAKELDGEADDESVLCAGDEFIVAELDTAKGKLKVGSMICYDREFPESARILMLKGAELVLVPNACPMEINRLSQLRGRAYENMFAIATCNYPAPHLDCNGHSTLFDGVVYLPKLSGSRDTCILETDESEGLFLAELDIDMLREFQKREHQNLGNRRPELYGMLAKR